MTAATFPQDRPLKVLFVSRKWAPAVGGMERYCVELTGELALHAQVKIIALPGHADGSPPSLRAMLLFPVKALWHSQRLKQAPDVLHVGDIAAWPLGLLGWLYRCRPLLVLSAHGTDVSYPRRGGLRGRLYRAYLRLGACLLRRAPVIANSAATARAAAESGWQASAIVPLATRIQPATPQQANGRHLLFAGRLIEQKGCRWFIENVLPLLPDGMSLKVAGTVWDQREAQALDHPRVSFLGPLDSAALTEAYRDALCVIVPNIELASGEFEGFGLIAAEAAAAGGLVLASATGGLIEAVIDGETGFHLPSGDPQEWAARISDIAGWSAAQRAAFLSRTMAAAQAHYGWPRVASAVMEVYRQGLERAETAP